MDYQEMSGPERIKWELANLNERIVRAKAALYNREVAVLEKKKAFWLDLARRKK